MGFNTSKKITQELKNEIAEKAGNLISGELKQKSIPHADAAGYPIMLSDHLSDEEFTKFNVYGSTDGVGTLDSESGKYKIPIVQRGKNLFNWEKHTISTNVTVTYADGVISLDNTGASVEEVFTIDNLPQGTYTVNADTSGASYYYSINGGSFATVSGGGIKTITLPNNINSFKMKVFPPSNGTLELKNVQLEMGNSATAYEEYKENTVIAFLDNALGNGEYIDLVNKKLHSADAVSDISVTGDLTSLESESITITCSSDVSPSKMEVTYYQDINKVIEELKNAILSQGGNV